MLARYAERLPSVEGNTFFYSVPPVGRLRRWAEQTPRSFRFCPKVPKDISHKGQLNAQGQALLGFLAHMREGLGERLGPLFLQLPPRSGPSAGHGLARLLNDYRRGAAGHPLLVELRHDDWYEEPDCSRIDSLLEALDLGRVMLDTRPVYAAGEDPQALGKNRKPKLPAYVGAPGPIAMVRYISHPDVERNRAALTLWAEMIHHWLEMGKEVYFFLHCPQEVFSPRVAWLLQELLEARGAPIPPLPWASLPDVPRLFGE